MRWAIWAASIAFAQDGATLFQEHCARCHSIAGRGGAVGPDLAWIALARTPAQLRKALLEPSAEIFDDFATATAGGVTGVILNEDDLSIQLRLADGSMRTFPRASARRTGASLMPPFRSLPAPHLEALIQYLHTLRGQPVEARPRQRTIARLAESTAWMTRPSREEEERPEQVLDALALRRDDTVADVGAGGGFFTGRIGRRVHKVIALDVQASALEANRKQMPPGVNAEFRLGSDLDPASVDALLVANSYHEFAEPEKMLAMLRASLKPGGRMLVIEYQKEKPGLPINETHRMSLEELRTEIEPAGFRLERILDFLPMQHGLLFTVAK
ncbi:MAG: methyltransferase domain-containing protein [Acidobacteria bacterium]|nr:methyltransferase domain-containing protein [Acidobacteriota bacterium]